jgi:hypothetical protein
MERERLGLSAFSSCTTQQRKLPQLSVSNRQPRKAWLIPSRASRQFKFLPSEPPDNADDISRSQACTTPIIMFTFIYIGKYCILISTIDTLSGLPFPHLVPPYHVTMELTSSRQGTIGKFSYTPLYDGQCFVDKCEVIYVL